MLYKMLGIRGILRVIQFWGPYLFAGIKVVYVSNDLREIKVRLKTSFWNTNYFGTHFGGSLYSMCDPFFVFIILDKLGKDHIAWDKASNIEFIKAVKEPVFVTFKLSSDQIKNIEETCLKQFKFEPTFEAEIVTSSGELVAKVHKRIYVRRKDAKTRFKAP